MLTFDLLCLNQSLMAHLHVLAISQHHCLFLSATRDKLILCSTSWSFSVIVTGYSAMMTLLFWECVCGMVRCMSLHQNVKTGETFWWLLRIDGCAVDDKSAVGLRTHSLAWSSCFWAFSKVMSLCHLYPLHLFTWLVVHTLLGITGKVACSFGPNWPTSLGCNGCQTCWCLVHPILLSLYLARWLSGHAWHPVWWYKHADWGLGLLYKEMFGVGASVVGPDTGWRWPQHQGTVRVNNISDQWKRMCWFSTRGVTKVQKNDKTIFQYQCHCNT